MVGAGPMQEVGRIAQKARKHRKEDVVGDDKMSDHWCLQEQYRQQQACTHTHMHTHTHTHTHTCTHTHTHMHTHTHW